MGLSSRPAGLEFARWLCANSIGQSDEPLPPLRFIVLLPVPRHGARKPGNSKAGVWL